MPSRGVWKSLEYMFTSQSLARTMQIHYQLATLKKVNSSIADYFHQFTNLADTFAKIDQPLNDLSLYLSFWLDLGLTTTLEDLHGHLLAHKMHLEQKSLLWISFLLQQLY